MKDQDSLIVLALPMFLDHSKVYVVVSFLQNNEQANESSSNQYIQVSAYLKTLVKPFGVHWIKKAIFW